MVRKLGKIRLILALLHEKSKLCIFTEEFLVSEAKIMSDRNYEMYVEKKHARAEGLAEGRAEGLAEGRAEGRAQGRAQGRAEMAEFLRSKGVAESIIAEALAAK